jgi:hypothetical protein
MKGANTISSSVKKASKVSKRQGKWANLSEICKKIPKTPRFKEPVTPILRYLVHEDRIEKKRNFSLWRPKSNGGGAFGGALAGAAVATATRASTRSVTNSIMRELW